jgi:PHP family Zn ribbon phosphoesterase
MSRRHSGVRYVNISRCVSCKEKLTTREVVYSGGVCPLCGNRTKSGSLVDCIEEVEKIEVPPEPPPKPKPEPSWWNLWGLL